MAKQLVKIGVLGMGTVGSGTVEVLHDHEEKILKNTGKTVEVTKILVQDKNRPRETSLASDYLTDRLTENADDILLDEDIEIVVELIGGEKPALDYIRTALKNGKHVVTANKEVISEHGKDLFTLAEEKGCLLLYEASVAGGIPVIRPLLTCLAGNAITEIYGILNGTTNFMLTDMENNAYPFDEILQKAQQLGYAENDPTDDIDGHDAVRKLAILTSIITGGQVKPGDIYTEGIRNITLKDVKWLAKSGYRIKLLAYTKVGGHGVESKVCPTFISAENPLYAVDDVYNSVLVRGHPVGSVTMTGEGAGKGATSSAVVADVLDAARFQKGNYYNSGWTEERGFEICPIEETSAWFYLRMRVSDASSTSKTSALDDVKQKLNQVGIEIIQQDTHETNDGTELYLITGQTKEINMLSAIKAIHDLAGIEVESHIRGELANEAAKNS